MSETKLYNAMLANALLNAGIAVLELQRARQDMDIGDVANYSPEMTALAKRIRDEGIEVTRRWLEDSFEAGVYDIIKPIPPIYKKPYRIRLTDGAEYLYYDPNMAIQAYFYLPESSDREFYYDSYDRQGSPQSFLLLATKSRITEKNYLDNAERDVLNTVQLISNIAAPYILRDKYVSIYGKERKLTVSKVDNGYEYSFVNGDKEVIRGIYENRELNIAYADAVIKQSIFDYGVYPGTQVSFARVNSREFIEMFGLPPYECTYEEPDVDISRSEGINTDIQINLEILKNMYKDRFVFSMTQEELENIVMDVVGERVAAAGLDVDKVECVIISGSYSNGTNNRFSDLDVQVVYSGSCTSEELSNVLNADPLILDGVTIDMHPCNLESFDIDSFINDQKGYFEDHDAAQERNMSADICDLLYGDEATRDNYIDITDCVRGYDGSTEGEQMLKIDIKNIKDKYADNKLSYEYLKSRELLDSLEALKEKNIDRRIKSSSMQR